MRHFQQRVLSRRQWMACAGSAAAMVGGAASTRPVGSQRGAGALAQERKRSTPDRGGPASNTLNVRYLTTTLESEAQLRTPAWELDSGRPGPCLLLLSTQHGNEVMGAEAIRRFIEAARRSELKGKVYAAPLANLLALRERRPHVGMKPEEPYGEARHRGTDMLHAWPGRENGNDIERVAFAIHEAFLRESTHVLDLHTHERCQAANVVVRDTPALRELAGKLGHRFVDAYSFEQAMSGKEHHILLTYADAQGKTSVLYNGAGQYVVSEPETTRMTRVVANFAKAIGLMAGPLEKGDDPVLFSDRTRSVRVTAPVAGLFVEKDLKLYDFIEQGALLGHILAEQDLWRHEVRSPRSGYLREYGASRAHSDVALPGSHPYVSEGDRLAKITWPT